MRGKIENRAGHSKARAVFVLAAGILLQAGFHRRGRGAGLHSGLAVLIGFQLGAEDLVRLVVVARWMSSMSTWPVSTSTSSRRVNSMPAVLYTLNCIRL